MKSKIIITVGFLMLGGLGFYEISKPSLYDIEIEKAYALKLAHPEITSFDGYEEPPIPDKKENGKTLLGVDSNNNGLRDDVEIWINRTQENPGIRKALRQKHFFYQKIMEEPQNAWSRDQEKERIRSQRIIGILDDMSEGVSCLRSYFDSYDDWSLLYEKFYQVEYQNSDKEKHFNRISLSMNGVGRGISVLSNEELRAKYCR